MKYLQTFLIQRCHDKLQLVILALVILWYCVVFSDLTILRHNAFYSSYFDLGCFEQGLWTTLNGGFFWNSPHGLSQFGIHNSPILFVLLPIYYLYPYSETLLVTQTILLSIAAIPLFFIGKRYLGSWGGLTFSIMYLLYPALHGVNLYDFHEMAFLPVILFSAIYYLLSGNIRGYIILSLMALLIKEDVVLLVFSLTAYGILYKKFTNNLERKYLFILIGVSIVWLLISLFVVIPFFNNEGYIFFSRYGSSNVISGIVEHNIFLKLIYVVILLAPLLFTPLAAPEFLLTLTPSFAEIFFQTGTAYRITAQYSTLLIPIIFTSAIMGTKRIMITLESPRIQKLILPGLLSFGIISFLLVTPVPISPITQYCKCSPNLCTYNINEHTNTIKEALTLIPQNASVSSQVNLASHLAKRNDLFLFFQPNVEYIILDTKTSNPEYRVNKTLEIPSEKYKQIYSTDGVEVYKKDN